MGTLWRTLGLLCAVVMTPIHASDGSIRFHGSIAVASCEVGSRLTTDTALPASRCAPVTTDPRALIDAPTPTMSWHRLDGSRIEGDEQAIARQLADSPATPRILYLNYP